MILSRCQLLIGHRFGIERFGGPYSIGLEADSLIDQLCSIFDAGLKGRELLRALGFYELEAGLSVLSNGLFGFVRVRNIICAGILFRGK